MGRRLIDRTGKRNGKLVAISIFDIQPSGARWICQCDCGKRVVISNITRTKSCGCLIIENLRAISLKHGFNVGNVRTVEYRIWSHMKERCYYPKAAHFKDYGGRGIKVCKRWLNSFPNFLKDMGKRPAGMTIDRKNNDGDYEPSNCRWISNKDQQSNRRNNKHLNFSGGKISYARAADFLGITPSMIGYRIKAGWTHEKIMLSPPDPAKQRFKSSVSK